MFRSLYAKLAAVLLALLVLVGIGCVALTLAATRHYLAEVDQKLHRGLAGHLVASYPVFADGQLQQESLDQIFHALMTVNPRIEVYLLDPEGVILDYSAPAGEVRRERVSLEPIRAFLSGARLPLTGDDPRSTDRRKIFTAAPIRSPAADAGDGVDGYLYVVLDSERYDSVVQMLRGSYILRLSAGAVLGSLGATLVVGLLLFRFFTLRLESLDRRMQDFEKSRFSQPPTPGASAAAKRAGPGDEIDRLERTFERMTERIAEQMDDLEQADRLRRELVANVSHDLRTPLASLQGYLETLLLKEETLPTEEKHRYLEIALDQSERLSKLVTELFELAKLDAGETPLDIEVFSLGELAQDVVQKFQLTAADRKISLLTELPQGLPFVRGDIRLIERVFENLLDNALRHTAAGGWVEVALAEEDGRVGVRVSDSGSGIPPAELPYIFDRFYRGGGSQEHDGAELGLAIARRVVELHGSELTVASTVGVGTSFRFELASRRL